jgi:UDP-glucuronate 4-epimerase
VNPQIQRVVLTGGAGFIGSHVAEALIRQGLKLTIIDCIDDFYAPSWKRRNLEEVRRAGNFEFIEADICEMAPLRRAIAEAKPDAILHLAARAGVRPSIEQPALYERVNVGGSINLLEISRELSVRKFVFGSSSSVYGATSFSPFSEDHVEMRPISPYAATKLAGEMICYAYAHLYKLPIVALRFFTVYGPRQRPDLAIHKFTALLESGKPLPVFGDGSSGRDYTHVDDIVRGVLSAVDYTMTGDVPYDVFNLGNSQPIKLSELIEQLEKATGRKAIRDQKPMQAGDVPLTWADVSKANRLLGYKPQVKIEEGLKRFVEWYRESGPGSRMASINL